MGLTGLGWSLFVLTHMLGNMLIMVSADIYNWYSHALTSNPFLIVAELLLLITIVLHAKNGIELTIQNRRAKPVRSIQPTNKDKSARFQSRFMIFHGSLILVFLIQHVLALKYGPHYTTIVNGVEMRDMYRLVIEVLHQPIYMSWYVLGAIGVGLHLSHGFYSSFQSLGIFHPRYSPWLSKFGYFYAFVVAAGYVVQPIFVFLAV